MRPFRVLLRIFRDARAAWKRELEMSELVRGVFDNAKRHKPGDECPQCCGAGKINVTARSGPGPLGWDACGLCHGKGVIS